MEPLAHLSKAIQGHVSVLPVAICLVAICTVAICRVARWILHALVVGVANRERVNQTNNQLVVGSLWDEAEEGLCGELMGVCCRGGGSRRKMDSGDVNNGRRRDRDGYYRRNWTAWRMSVLAAQLDSGGTDNRWTASAAAAMGGDGIAMDVVGRGEINGRRRRDYNGCW